MAEVFDLSTTDASNTGRWPEAMALSSVNNAGRSMEGYLARHHKDVDDSIVTTGGTSTAYTASPNRVVASYHDGLTQRLQFHTASGATPTINLDSVGAKDLYFPDGTQITTNDIPSGLVGDIVYDSGNDRFVLLTNTLDLSLVVTPSSTTTFTNKTFDAGGTGNSLSLTADSVDAITEIAAALKTGSDTKLVTGTAGTSGNLVQWDANGDAIDSGSAASDFGSAWTYDSAVDASGGTEETLTLASSLASTLTEIEIMVNAVSTDAANQAIVIRLGDSGGVENTGYVWNSANILTSSVTSDSETSGFRLGVNANIDAAEATTGILRLHRGADNTHWFASFNGRTDDDLISGAGDKTLDTALTQIQATTTGGTAQFDAGNFIVRYR